MKRIFLVCLITICGVLYFMPVQAEEESTTSTPDTIVETPTSTEEIITPTSTPEIETPTSTEEIITPTSTPEIETPTNTEEIITPTTTPDIESPTSTIETTTSTTSTPETGETEENNGGSNSTPEIQNILLSNTEINNTISKILDYLRSQQDETGKISDGTITDWAIMSFGANNQYADDIKNTGDSLLDYEKKYNLDDSSDLNVCASYPRHILALLSAGVGKNDNAILGLQNKIMTECYKDNLYGQDGINDDVFGLLALLAIDTNKDELIIQDILNTIKADQNNEGAFTWSGSAGADMTGAAINALKYAQTKNIEIDNQVFLNAKNYLKNQQLADGGWSDIMTTSWVLMGINALGENQSDWFNSVGKNPWYPFIQQINETGFYESVWVPGSVDWFAMKHAVPALAGKSWPIILPEKVQNFSSGGGLTYTYSAIENNSTTSTEYMVTTTIDIVTTTLEIVTTTLDIVTSTPEIVTTTIEILEIPTTTKIMIISASENTTSTNNSPTTTTNNSMPKYIKPIIPTTPTDQISFTSSSDSTIISPSSTLESATPEIAKKVFTASAGMGGSLLVYLIWKIIKSLV